MVLKQSSFFWSYRFFLKSKKKKKGFTGGFNFIYCLLQRWRKSEDGWNSFLAGAIAAMALLIQPKETRRTVSLYLFCRLLQCTYNSAKKRGWWHLWGSSWNHGDTLLFALTSGFAMYAYVMRPESLPSSYYKFIVRTGPIDEIALEAVRRK